MGIAKLTCLTCEQLNRVETERLGEEPKCGSCGDRLLPEKVPDLDGTTHDKAVKNDELPILVDYWAPWCGPCRAMAPEFARAARLLWGRARLVKLNTENNPKIANRARIQGIPALVLYKGGREVARLAGSRPATQIVAFVDKALPKG